MLPESADVLKLQERIRNDPEFFHNEILDYEPWERQLEISHSITNHRNTTVRSCNGAGKTFHIAREGLRFLLSYYPAVVFNTAPVWSQVENQYWRYLRDAYAKANYRLGGKLLKTSLNFSETWFAMGLSNDPNRMEAFQGWHGENVLVIFDEASGIHPKIYEAALGAMAGGHTVRFVLIGNPTQNSGDFYDSFKDPTFNKITISAYDVPNVKERRQVVPGLVTHDWVEELAYKYGRDSDIFKVRALGEFPRQASNTLISIDAVERAINADRERQNEDDHYIGLDVARFGDDDTAFVFRAGNFAKVLEKYNGNNLMETAGKAVRYLKEYPKARLFIDVIGVGAGVFDRLREQSAIAGRVFGVNSASTPRDPAEFLNIRVESWVNVREWLRDGILEKDENWYQLANPEYKITSSGKLQLEGKEDMKKRGVNSPDCFVAGTMIATPKGEIPIEEVIEGTIVTTPMGPRKVVKQWISETDNLTTTSFSNGSKLTGKGRHKVFTWDKGFVRLDALALSNTIETISTLWLWNIRNSLYTKNKNIGFKIQVDTIPVDVKLNPSVFYTGIFGLNILVQFLANIIFTIKTVIGQITVSKILSVFKDQNIQGSTWKKDLTIVNMQSVIGKISPKLRMRQKSGMPLMRGENGIVNTEKEHGMIANQYQQHAQFAKNCTQHSFQPDQDFAHAHVNRNRDIYAEKQQKRLVQFVEKILFLINIKIKPVVPVSVQHKNVPPTIVYNLTLEEDNVYYANGILVANCADALALTLSKPTEGDNMGVVWI